MINGAESRETTARRVDKIMQQRARVRASRRRTYQVDQQEACEPDLACCLEQPGCWSNALPAAYLRNAQDQQSRSVPCDVRYPCLHTRRAVSRKLDVVVIG